jgi:hypothetical protein
MPSLASKHDPALRQALVADAVVEALDLAALHRSRTAILKKLKQRKH